MYTTYPGPPLGTAEDGCSTFVVRGKVRKGKYLNVIFLAHVGSFYHIFNKIRTESFKTSL